jgi:exodeoxyribonuclease VII large subunit
MDWIAQRLAQGPITVSELNRFARAAIEETLPLLWVGGEVSNFVRAASGHWYFSLKDADAQVRCVMFRHRAQHLDWRPENGVKVEARAVPSLYEPRGDFQLNVEFLRRAGLGSLHEQFERLKAKLGAQGLFDPDRKRALPSLPRGIGVVTSPSGAALRDVLVTLRTRMPAIPVIVYPTPVQGEGAAPGIVAALDAAARRVECDVLILCRGGGSLEDLWAFNDERVARAIAGCPIPIVAGIGHETDVTIADFVADFRAATPTAAAQRVVPDRRALLDEIGRLRGRLERGVWSAIERRAQLLDHLGRRLVHPRRGLEMRSAALRQLAARVGRGWRQQVGDARWELRTVGHRLLAGCPDLPGNLARIDLLRVRLSAAIQGRLRREQGRIAACAAHVSHADPRRILARGFSIVRMVEDGSIVRDAAAIRPDATLDVQFGSGGAVVRVTAVRD